MIVRPDSHRKLFELGRQRRFSGRELSEIAFPLGGIGTGTVSLGGRGQLRDWEIFNRPAKGRNLPYTFFALWARTKGGKPIARILESQLQPPFTGAGQVVSWGAGGFGPSSAQVSGLPRLAKAVFRGEYPFAWIDFQDPSLAGLGVTLEAWNPMIPLNAKDSGIPAAIFLWRLENRSKKTIEATLAFSLMNACGYDGKAGLGNRHWEGFGKNLNELVREEGAAGFRYSAAKYTDDHPQFGTMALLSPWRKVTWSLHWQRARWWDDLQHFWDDFCCDGLLPNQATSDPSPDGQTDVATLGLQLTLSPGERARLPFVLAWHFPNLTNYWNNEESVKGKRLGNWYATQWCDALDTARYVVNNYHQLDKQTRAFHEALYSSTLPSYVLDAVGSQMSVLRTTTCLRTEDGRFHAFEGCHDNSGCCPLNCTHVWNYEQSLAHLYPALERTMRETDFGSNLRKDGSMAFRTLIPLYSDAQWRFKPAADGQMGGVMKLYREWKMSGDTEWLKKLWPEAKRSLEFAWNRPKGSGSWDANRDGVMEGEQHNTYDIDFYGPNTMVGSLYLGALRAGEEMAHAAGDLAAASKYRAIFAKGRARIERELWNGSWFEQKVLMTKEAKQATPTGESQPRYQYGAGCQSDQLLGQWFARVCGLGDLLEPNHIRKSLASIFRYNWCNGFCDHHNCQRTYAVNDERGLLLCSWPKGDRPQYPFPYADEVWTGIEYQVAAHCIYEGLVAEGLSIVNGVRNRYDGVRRNPWDEFECGHHYARAMSSWSLLLALSGYRYDAVAQTLSFTPKINPNNFCCFFTVGSGWGIFEQRRRRGSLALLGGSLALKELAVRGKCVARGISLHATNRINFNSNV